MKIGIDARFYGSSGKGLGRYTQKLIQYLEQTDRANEYYILMRRENWNDYTPANRNFNKVMADYRWYSLSEQLLMPLKLWRLGLDVIHFTHFNVPRLYFGDFIVTIHDLTYFKYPTQRATRFGRWWYKIKHFGFEIIINAAIKRAKKIITLSEFTKQEVIGHFGLEASTITVTHAGVDPQISDQQVSEEVLARYGISQPYLLYVGNAHPHKNLERLVLSFRTLIGSHEELKLVLVGKEDCHFDRLKTLVHQHELDDEVVFAGFVADNDLPHLYEQAKLYLFPSLCEGFGLPALEACLYGLPVIASDNSCLPEILGDAGVFFDPENVDDMRDKIEAVLSDEALQASLRERGYARVTSFDWGEMSRATLKLYMQSN